MEDDLSIFPGHKHAVFLIRYHKKLHPKYAHGVILLQVPQNGNSESEVYAKLSDYRYVHPGRKPPHVCEVNWENW